MQLVDYPLRRIRRVTSPLTPCAARVADPDCRHSDDRRNDGRLSWSKALLKRTPRCGAVSRPYHGHVSRFTDHGSRIIDPTDNAPSPQTGTARPSRIPAAGASDG